MFTLVPGWGSSMHDKSSASCERFKLLELCTEQREKRRREPDVKEEKMELEADLELDPDRDENVEVRPADRGG